MPISWKAKVARSILAGFTTLLLTGLPATAQPSTSPIASRTVTLSCKQTPFEQVLQLLTQQTGVFFAYSSRFVNTHYPISLSVQNKPLEAVITSLCRELNLDFKKQGNYYILKRKTPEPQISVPDSNRVASSFSLQETVPRPSLISPIQFHTSSILQNPDDLILLPDASTSTLPGDSIFKSINAPLPAYKSGSTLAFILRTGIGLDEATMAGATLQAGLPFLYGTLHTGLVNTLPSRIRYGAGFQIPVAPYWSLGAEWTTSSSRREFSVYVPQDLKVISQYHRFQVTGWCHLSSRMALALGPSFNLLSHNYFPKGNLLVQSTVPGPVMQFEEFSSSGSTSYQISVYQSGNSFRRTRTWIGFQVSMLYSIRIPYRRY